MPIHIRASGADIAPIVFLPGDPDRSKAMASQFLREPVLYTSYRQLLGYTGFLGNLRVSVQSTGMGGPSAAIVCEELVQLGAKYFIRVGTCGAMSAGLEPGDIILASAACAMDGTSQAIFGRPGFAPTSDFAFLQRGMEFAQRRGFRAVVGPVASLDCFYGHDAEYYEHLGRFGILAVEMEASTVLTLAAKYGIRGAAIFVVSDILEGQRRASDEVIWEGVSRMMELGQYAASVI